MVKNIILYIFIYVFCIGCLPEDSITNSDSCSNSKLELSIDELDKDNNGYYHLYFNNDYIQTFTKIKADVGYEYEYVGWTSDTYFVIETNGYQEQVNVVNGSSYTNSEGFAYTMLGVYEQNIGDTIIVYCGYYDNCSTQHLNSLGVIIK
jgi:hypothetical protein